jgi:hypothetical protein
MQSYSLSFELNELPPGLNIVLRLNRWRRAELYKSIYGISNSLIGSNRPPKPLTKFNLVFTRQTIRPLDLDGLTASFKPFLDALVRSKVIEDDNWNLVNFENTKFNQLKVNKKSLQKISIEVKG